MTNLTLQGWKQSVATGVVETVPLQTLETALVLAEDFLATQGGWNPDDAGDPTGPGEPVSGVTTQEAIVLITNQQLDRIYHVAVDGNLEFRVVLNENLSVGLPDNDVLANVVDRLDDFVQANLQDTNIEFVNIPSFTGTVTSGPTTAQERRDIQLAITGGGKIIDPIAIAVSAGRATFNLDNTHNATYLYTEPNKVLFVLIQKYTDTLYDDVDMAATSRYSITLDANSFKVTGGIVLSN